MRIFGMYRQHPENQWIAEYLSVGNTRSPQSGPFLFVGGCGITFHSHPRNTYCSPPVPRKRKSACRYGRSTRLGSTKRCKTINAASFDDADNLADAWNGATAAARRLPAV
jgi:hypothetical protein